MRDLECKTLAKDNAPICDICNSKTYPVFYTEAEEGTGRKKLALSHFECIRCYKKFTVDDSFDGEWRER